MGSLSVRDDLNGGDQEAALKDLLSSVGDLEDVDPNEVWFRRAKLPQAPGPDANFSRLLQLPPPGLACDLLPHQIAGLAWLKKRESADLPLKPDGAKAEKPAEEGEELTELKMPERDPKKEAAAAAAKKKQKKKAGAQTEKFGGILADDMGLGKTVQMSA